MSFVRLTFILLFWNACSSSALSADFLGSDKLNQVVKDSLDILNANENKVVIYKNAVVTSANKDHENIKLELDVETECIDPVHCFNLNQKCYAYLLPDPALTLQDVQCVFLPTRIDLDLKSYLNEPPPVEGDVIVEKVEPNNDQLSSGSEDPILPEKNLCCGFPEDVDTNIEGLDLLVDTALRQVEASKDQRHALVKILRVQRQVVAGIKYTLTLEIAPTTCKSGEDLSSTCPLDQSGSSIICEVSFVEQPWITKDKRLIGNNCTNFNDASVPSNPEEKGDNDETNGYIALGPVNKPKKSNDVSGDLLAEIESQIITDESIDDSKSPVPDLKPSQPEPKPSQPELKPSQNIPNNEDDDLRKAIEELIIPDRPQGKINSAPEVVPNVNNQDVVVEEQITPLKVEQPKTELNLLPMYAPHQNNWVPVDEPLSVRQTNTDLNTQAVDAENVPNIPSIPENPVNLNYGSIFDPPYAPNSGLNRQTFNTENVDYMPITPNIPAHPNYGLLFDPSSAWVPNPIYVRRVNEPSTVYYRDNQPYTSPVIDLYAGGYQRQNEISDVADLIYKNKNRNLEMEYSNVEDFENHITQRHGNPHGKFLEEAHPFDPSFSRDESQSNVAASITTNDKGHHKNKRTIIRSKRALRKFEKITIQEKPLIHDLAGFVAMFLDGKDEDNYRNVVLNTFGAKKLKLKGFYYNFIVRLGISRCPEDKYATLEECKEKLFVNLTKICKVQVHVDVEYSNPKIVKSQCQNIKKDEFDKNRTNFSRYRRNAPGDKIELNNATEALLYLTSSLKLWDKESGHPNKLKIKEVISVTSHPISGTLWKIRAEVMVSNCLKTDSKESHECGELPGSETRICTFKVWDRPWLPHGKETDIKCDNELTTHKFRSKRGVFENLNDVKNSRTKRGIPGGVDEKAINDLVALEYLKSSLNHLDSDSGHSNKLKVKKVISVTSQVVAGSKLVIKAEVITSDCEKSSDKNADECGELQGAQSKVCEFEIWDRPWWNKQETSVRCENEAEKKYRSKRSTTENFPAFGAPTTESVDNKQALEHVKNSLNLLDSDSGHPNKLKVKKIISVSSQVVAGWKWVIKAEIITSDCEKSSNKNADICGELQGAQSKVCEFEIWEQPSKKQETSVRCENEAEKKYRSKRSTNEDIPAIGAPTTESVDNKQALEHVKNSLNLLDSDSGHPNKLKVKKIISVSSQVVAGWKWVIKAEIITSDCEKSSNKNADICGELQGAQSKVCEFEIWEQPSKKQETSVRCENEAEKKYRSKRSTNEDIPALGAPTTESVDNKQALEHVKNSLNLLDSDSGHPNKLKVKKIISVSSQVVSGWKWVIKAEIITSDCEKSSDKNADICGELQGAQSKVCEFEIWEQASSKKKETSVRCENEAEKKYRSKRSTNEDILAIENLNDVKNSRTKRGLPGGASEKPTNDLRALEYLKSSLNHLDSDSGHSNKLKVKKVISVTSQVVAGSKWVIKAEVITSDCEKSSDKNADECGELQGAQSKVCEFEIWDRPWLNKQETSVRCENEAEKKYRSKRSTTENFPAFGAPTTESVDNKQALEHVKNSLNLLDSDSGHPNKLKVKKIISVSSQVVAGWKWVIKAEIITSDCEKSSNKNADICGELQGAQSKVCEFEIWEQPSKKQETSVRCENEAEKKYRSKRSTNEDIPALGAPTTESVDNKQALEHVKNSLNLLDSDSGHTNKLKVKKIISVSSQVVSGWKWVIKAEIITSDCEKSSDKNADICGELQGAQSKVCEFEIWEQASSKKKETSVRCENEAEKKYRSKRSTNEDILAIENLNDVKNSRTKRGLPGGASEQPTNDLRALEYLKSSLNHLDSDSGHSNKLKVKKVISVTSQVVAGSKWVIKAEVITSDCEKSSDKNADECGELQGAQSKVCEFEIWDRPWLNKQETSVRCENEAEKKYRSKRSTTENFPAFGAPTTESVDNKQALEHVKNSLNLLDSDSGHPNKLKVKKIISVSSQVVAGWKWVIKAEIITSDCEKSSDKNADICGELQGAQSKVCEFEIWEQPSSKKQETSVRCENEAEKKYRSKRSTNEDIPALGAPTAESVDNKQALEHIKNTLNLMDFYSGHPNKLKVKKIISVSSQMVAGWKWVIKVEIITSDCEKSSDKNTDICGELQGAQSKVCEFEIWEQASSKQKETSVRCENEADEKYRSKRSTNEDIPAVGAPTTESVDNKQALEHVKNSLNLLDSDSGHTNKLKVKKIISVSSQVVSGWKWVIKAEIITSDCEKSSDKNADICGELQGAQSKVCEFEIWEQASSKQKETSVRCENEAEKKYRSKRSTNEDIPAIGAPTTESVDNKQALEHVKNSLNLLDSDSGHPNKLKVKKIISVTSQVVAGQKWIIKAEIIVSDCAKDSGKEASDCGELTGTKSKICEFEIWDRPWLKKKEVSVKCENEETKKYKSKRSIGSGIPQRRLLGAPAVESLDNPKAIRYVLDGLLHLDSTSNNNNKLKIEEILSVTKQIVAGQKWNIKARVAESDCSVDDSRESQNCGYLQGAESKICTFEILDQPWLPNGKQTDIKCDNNDKLYSYRSKRSLGDKYSLPSSFDGESPNTDVYDFVQLALEYLDSQSSYDTTYALKEILKVSKTKEQGMMWRIKASIGISDCVKGSTSIYCEPTNVDIKICTFKVWEQSSSDTKKLINIKCKGDPEEYTFVSDPKIELNTKSMFQDFMKTHLKRYSSKVEYDRRFKVFRDNLKIIENLNRNEQGTGQYGVTKFSDLTPEEFSSSHGLNLNLKSENDIPFAEADIPDIDLPTEFDWRKKNAVTEVKDQGQCGSCWAFSTTGNVEGQYAIKNGKLLEFSEQELVDCDKLDEGCNGGLMDNAYRMIEKMGGLELEQDYPYEAENEKCHFDKTKVRVQLSGALNISHDETSMAKWLVANGPISIAINANAMQFYVGGVSHPWKYLCNPKSLDHGVLIVGYGVHKYPLFNKTMPYWLVKNSWGKSWGEQGYYRVYRGDGTCGLNQTPSSAIVA